MLLLSAPARAVASRSSRPGPPTRAAPGLARPAPATPSSSSTLVARSLKADAGVDSIHDWRGKQMQEAIDVYFKDLWSKVKE